MKRVLLAAISLALVLLLVVNVRLHRPGNLGTAEAQLRSLEEKLGNGAAEEMQELFPEGYVFTWSLYGLSSAQLARQLPPDDARRPHLLAETRRALAAVRSEKGREIFDAEMDRPYGAFHTSWSLLLLAEYVRAAGPRNVPPEVLAEFTREADRFAQALGRYGSPFMESYPEQVWPGDTSPGIAALGIYDATVGPRYGAVIRQWVADARARMDPRLHALTHTAEPRTGRPSGGVRGESLALMSRLLVDADPAFAREQYAVLRAHFLDSVLGVPGFLEYPRGMRGAEDMDTGPLILGFSGPAVVVGATAARVNGDLEVADAVLGGVEVTGVPIQLGGRRTYAFGELPVGDAFIAWAVTSPAGGQAQRTWEPASQWTFLPFHALSAAIASLLVWWAHRIARPRRGRAGGARTAGSAAPLRRAPAGRN